MTTIHFTDLYINHKPVATYQNPINTCEICGNMGQCVKGGKDRGHLGSGNSDVWRTDGSGRSKYSQTMVAHQQTLVIVNYATVRDLWQQCCMVSLLSRSAGLKTQQKKVSQSSFHIYNDLLFPLLVVNCALYISRSAGLKTQQKR